MDGSHGRAVQRIMRTIHYVAPIRGFPEFNEVKQAHIDRVACVTSDKRCTLLNSCVPGSTIVF